MVIKNSNIELRIIRENECRAITGLSRTTRYQLEKVGLFPTRRSLGGRAIGWLSSDIKNWLEATRKIK
ncbi:helix-turn-helix transcriptional regulator [Pectobacterium brasiliense]|uniref:helix-turn-helix transcriptional regulator n=1 Tax=Pectobacterium brasiliense TaxID=180957 RepID=UPI001CF10BD1|nr:AlpA family phage regulatory protein [Pectobacterium brasiliense]MCA6984711.1 AlpA family phage regulatory protein [Pectobacterium brasiliense]MCH4994244.1 AlpA family phage regulatory protein [Pectobacterium brasiliense]